MLIRTLPLLRVLQVITSAVEATCDSVVVQAGQPENSNPSGDSESGCHSAVDRRTAVQAEGSRSQTPSPHDQAISFLRSLWHRLAAVLALKRDAARFRRALRNSIAITMSGCLAVAVDRLLLGGQGYSFWAPTTVALIVARGVDAPTYSSVRERLVVSRSAVSSCSYKAFKTRCLPLELRPCNANTSI